MKTEKVHLTKEKATLLLTLYGKALDSRAEHPILGDTFADEVVRRLDFDFEAAGLPKGGEISLPVRAKHLDGWTREFIAANPSSTVLHLGCGLDSRVFRVDPPATVRWYDVDQAEVIDLRRRLYPERPGYTLVASSVTDLEWLDSVEGDRPVLVVAEGLVLYLQKQPGLALFRAIAEKFPSGQLIFDAYSRSMIRLMGLSSALKKTGAVLSWAIDDPHEIEREVPRLHLVSAVPFLTMPELVVIPLSRPRALIYRLMKHRAFVKKLIQHLRYQF